MNDYPTDPFDADDSGRGDMSTGGYDELSAFGQGWTSDEENLANDDPDSEGLGSFDDDDAAFEEELNQTTQEHDAFTEVVGDQFDGVLYPTAEGDNREPAREMTKQDLVDAAARRARDGFGNKNMIAGVVYFSKPLTYVGEEGTEHLTTTYIPHHPDVPGGVVTINVMGPSGANGLREGMSYQIKKGAGETWEVQQYHYVDDPAEDEPDNDWPGLDELADTPAIEEEFSQVVLPEEEAQVLIRKLTGSVVFEIDPDEESVANDEVESDEPFEEDDTEDQPDAVFGDQFEVAPHPEVTAEDMQPATETTKQGLLDTVVEKAMQGGYVPRRESPAVPGTLINPEEYYATLYTSDNQKRIVVHYYPEPVTQPQGDPITGKIHIYDGVDLQVATGVTYYEIKKTADGSLDIERHIRVHPAPDPDTIRKFFQTSAREFYDQLPEQGEALRERIRQIREGKQYERTSGMAFTSNAEAGEVRDLLTNAIVRPQDGDGGP